MTGLFLLILALILGGVGFFAWKTILARRTEAAEKQELAEMEADIASDGIADGDPVVHDIVQAARDEGRV